MDETIDKAVEELKTVLKDPKNKGAAVGATLAYLLSKDNKERNTVLGGLAGYFISKKNEENY